jgi:hypothetical protein
MKKMVEQFLENLSTRDMFLFRMICGGCGKEYANKSIRFSKAGQAADTQAKKVIFEAVYEQEFRFARQAAIRDAAEHMNYCPICKRLVCNKCFLICDDLDMCRDCASALKQQGSPVMTEIIECETI